MTTATQTGATQMTSKFEIGKTYSVRSACDYDCVFSFTVVSRTAKTITLEKHGRTSRRGITICPFDNAEVCYPLGRYSMAPIIRATS